MRKDFLQVRAGARKHRKVPGKIAKRRRRALTIASFLRHVHRRLRKEGADQVFEQSHQLVDSNKTLAQQGAVIHLTLWKLEQKLEGLSQTERDKVIQNNKKISI